MPNNPSGDWLSSEAAASLEALGQDAYAEVAADLRQLLTFEDFRREVAALVLEAVRDPVHLPEAIDSLCTLCCIWASEASAALGDEGMGEIIALVVMGAGVKAGLKAGNN